MRPDLRQYRRRFLLPGSGGIPANIQAILDKASAFYSAKNATAQAIPDTAPNGHGGSAQFGSTAGSDTNDPLLLPHTGENYVFIPDGVANANVLRKVVDIGAAGATTTVLEAKRVIPSTGSSYIFNCLNANTSRLYLLHSSATMTLILTNDGTGAAVSVNSNSFDVHAQSYFRATIDWNANGALIPQILFETSTDGTTWTSRGVKDFTVATRQPDGAGTCRIGTTFGNGTAGGISYAFVSNDGVKSPMDFDASLISTAADPDDGQVSTPDGFTVIRGTTGLTTAIVTRPVILFDGVDDYIQLPAADQGTHTAIAGSRTAIPLVRQHLFSGSDFIFEGGPGFRTYTDGAGNLQHRVGDLPAIQAATAPTASEMYAPTGIVEDGNLRLWTEEDGMSSDQAIAGTPSNQIPRVGAQYNVVSNTLGGEFFGVLLFDEALTETEISDMATYLKTGAL